MIKKFTIVPFLMFLVLACAPLSTDRKEEQPSAPTQPVLSQAKEEVSPPTPPPLKTEAPASGGREASPGVIDKWGLWVNGPHLRGVDLHPCLLFTEDGCVQPISRQDIQDLRNLGANLINASYPGLYTEDAPYQVNPTALAYLDNLIGWAEEVGVYVVIHFRTGPGRNEGAITGDGEPRFEVWADQTAHDAWVEMWRFTAGRYRNSPAVAGYDLMVEPHPNTLIDPDLELEPPDVQAQLDGTLMDWNAFAAEISTAIRQVDPDTPIIVSSISWASAEWFSVLQPTGDPRTVYSLHAYDPDIYIIQEEGEAAISYPDVVDDYGESITFDRAWLDENYRPAREFAGQHDAPIYVGEFGAVRWVPDAANFLSDQTGLFEQYGWNNAIYVWRGDETDFDGFNMEYGPDPKNHAIIPDNPLLGILRERWAQNVDFPGNVTALTPSQPSAPENNEAEIAAPNETKESTPAADKWNLWVNGPHLRGANIWQAIVIPKLDGLEFKGSGAVGPPFTQADFEALAAAGANYVSLSVPGLFTEKPPFELDPAVQKNLDHLLEMAANANLFATISVRTGPGRSEFGICCDGEPGFEGYYNDTMWEDAAAQDAWVEMWRATAARYRDNPNVAGYKLMVEPNSAGLLLDIYEPDEFYANYGGTSYDWNQLYPRLVAAIRNVDPNTPILIGGNGWSAVPWLPYVQPVAAERIVYIVHQYEPQDDYTHQEGIRNSYPGQFDTNGDGALDRFDRAWLENFLQPVADFSAKNGVPVAVDEFGVNRWAPGAAQFMDDEMALFEQMGMNMAYWEWASGWRPFVEDVNDMEYRFGPEPGNTTPVPNDLWNVVQKYWSRNTIRPSNFYADAQPSPAGPTRPDGAAQLTRPPAPASDQNPAFSPAGAPMIFTRFKNGYNDGPADLFLLNPDAATAPTLLATAPDSDNVNLPGSSWNAATGQITFASDREDSDEIWTMAADGSNLHRVTRHTGGYFIEPSFSADGEWIVFERDDEVPDDSRQGSIWKVRAGGSDLTELTDSPGGGSDDRQPNWSPAGDRILFQRRQPGSEDWNIFTMAPDGSDIRPVTTSSAGDTDASWSPDGRWIVYSSDHGGLPVPNIFIIPATGGEPVRVTRSKTQEDGAPSWSPDGHWIAFESHPGQDEETPSAVWRIAAPDIAAGDLSLAAPEPAAEVPVLAGVQRWFYMIDVNLEPEMVQQIADSDYDLVVLDFISSEAENIDFPMAQVIEQLHHAPHPKQVIAYIDIGQAEDFRTYWQPGWGIGHPEWITGLDPDGWEGNYPVAYWDEAWRNIWLAGDGYIPAIVKAGFDGIYLDWVEAYSDENVIAAAQSEGVDPRREMVWWVADLAETARSRNLDFIVIAQNAAELAADEEYRDTIDAIAQEQVWFDGSADNDPPGDCPLPRTEAEVDTAAYRNSLSPACQKQYDEFPDSTLHVSSQEYLNDLILARDEGEKIFTIDYALEPENVTWIYETSRGLGFVPFAGNRALDQFIEPYPFTALPPATGVTPVEGNWWQPAINSTWQWQLEQNVDPSFEVEVYDIDLFDNEAAMVANLHAQGRKVICYISVGSWEEWRPDANQFPTPAIGNDYGGWPGEKWLDIRQIDLLAPIMLARLDECQAKGFDGVEPDNIDSFANDTGFPLTDEDQLNYNIWLANQAHARGLSIGLKNDPDQVDDLLPYFDYALTEDCFAEGWCEEMQPFITAGKPVFAAEYTDMGLTSNQFCSHARKMNFSAILKNRNLDAWQEACP